MCYTECHSTGWAKKPDRFYKFVIPAYVDTEKHFIYQTVQFFICSKTGMLQVTVFNPFTTDPINALHFAILI